MSDLRIVDAPEIPTEEITGSEKLPTGGNGNYSISLDSIANHTKKSLDLANKTDVQTSSNGVKAQLDQHKNDLNNPHQVTKGQIGLGNVNNTADADKPMSNAVQSAITTLANNKADKTSVYLKTETYNKSEIDSALSTKPNSTTVYTKTETDNLLNGKVTSVNGKTGTAITLNRSDLGISSDIVMQQWEKEAQYVIDGSGLTQQQINNGVDNISDLLLIPSPNNGNRVFVKSIQKYYTYKQSNSEESNGVTIVGNWVMDKQDQYLASWFATPNVISDQRVGLQTGWNFATSKNSRFIFDGVFYVAQLPYTYSDGLVRKVGLQVPSNSETYFTENASLRLIPNNEPLGYVLNFYLTDNFKIYNPVIYGDVDQHTGITDESNHCFNIVNCKNGYIHKPVAYNAWGDGFYIGVEYSGLTNKQCQDVTVFEPYAEHCGRAGISVTSGINVNIYSPKFKDIFRVLPRVGINIEGEGIGATLPVFESVNVLGTIQSEGCDIAASVFIFNSVQGDVDINIGDVVSKDCVVSVVAQLFSNNSGSVRFGNIYATAWKSSILRNNWSQMNCTLEVGNLYSINANCNGTVERFSSIVSTDVDAENQPLVNIGKFKIGDIHITDINTTKVMHPYYFKDNTSATYGARKLDKGVVGKVYGKTLIDAFYADGMVTSNFVFNMKYSSSYFQPIMKPYLYSEIDIEASGNDFLFAVGSDYRTPLKINKKDLGVSPLKVVFQSGTSMHPPSLGTNSGIQTIVSGSSISYSWKDNSNIFILNQIGTWTSY